jgi:hypothetical protein
MAFDPQGAQDIIVANVRNDLGDILERAYNDGKAAEVATVINYKITVNAPPPKDGSKNRLIVERTYAPPPNKEARELFAAPVEELPLFEGVKDAPEVKKAARALKDTLDKHGATVKVTVGGKAAADG